MRTQVLPVKVLLIEDDEDDFYLVRYRLSRVSVQTYTLEWISEYYCALDALVGGAFDVCLLDYRLGERSGIDLLKDALSRHCTTPVIMLSGRGDYGVDLEAMHEGAADYLPKDEISSNLLERSIRYSIDRMRANEELRKSRDDLEELVRQRTDKLSKANGILLESEAFTSSVLNALSAHVAILDEDGFILCTNLAWKNFANANGLELYDFERANYLLVCDNVAGEGEKEAAAVAASIREVLSGSKDYFELEYPCHSPGENRWFNTRVTRFRDHVPPRVVVAHEVVTERRQMQEALRENRERLRMLIEFAPLQLAMFDREMRYISVSRKWSEDNKLVGRDLIGLSYYEMFPGIAEKWKAIHRRALAGEILRGDEDLFERADGSAKWIRWEVRPWHDAAGDVGGIVIFSDDITGQKDAEGHLDQLDRLVRERTSELESANGRLHREIAERKALEIELEEYLRFFNISNEPMTILDLGSGCIRKINPSGARLLGYAEKELVDSPFRHLIHPDDRQRTLDRVKSQLEGGVTENFEIRCLSKDGAVRLLSFRAARDAVSGLTYATARDITERRQMVEKLRRSEEKYRHIVENAIEGIFQSADNRFVTVNPAFAGMFGFDSPDQMIREVDDLGRECFADPMDRLRIHEQLQSTNPATGLEVQVRKRGGETFWVVLNVRGLRDSDGDMVSFDGFATDVTRRKLAEEEARGQKEILEKVFESAPYIMLLVDSELRVTKINRVCADFSGRSKEEAVGLLPGEAFSCIYSFSVMECGKNAQRSVCPLRSNLMHTFQTGESIREAEIKMTLRKGAADVEADFLISTVLISNRDSNLVLITMADVTARTRARKALRESEERFRELAENIRDVFWVRDSDRLLYISPAYEQIWGRSRESLYQDPAPFMESVHPDNGGRVCQGLPAGALEDAAFYRELRITRPDGTLRWIRARSFPVLEQGRLVRTVGIAEDFTSVKETEELVRIQRDLAFGLGSAGGLREALEYLLEACLELDHLDSGGIYLVESETGTLRLAFHLGLSDRFVERLSLFGPESPQALFIKRGKPVFWSRSAVDIFDMSDLLVREGITALGVIPVKCGGEIVAVLALSSHEEPELPRSVRDALEVISAHIGGLIWRVKLMDTVRAQRESLRETNSALKVLLKQREEDRTELEESLLRNVRQLVLPYLEKLKKSRLHDEQNQFLEIIETHLLEITSPFVRKLSAPLLGLTPSEIRIADLIRQGNSTKEIADLLAMSEHAVNFHRQSIRKKLGLTSKKLNLQTYLGSLQQ